MSHPRDALSYLLDFHDHDLLLHVLALLVYLVRQDSRGLWLLVILHSRAQAQQLLIEILPSALQQTLQLVDLVRYRRLFELCLGILIELLAYIFVIVAVLMQEAETLMLRRHHEAQRLLPVRLLADCLYGHRHFIRGR